MSSGSSRTTSVRYQPDESPPAALAFGCGLQLVILGGASIVLIPTIVIRAAGSSEAYLCPGRCSVQSPSAASARRCRRFAPAASEPATSSPWARREPFIGLSAAALAQGGPALLGTLVAASSLLPIVLSTRLSLFRRLLTPTIVGTVNMLIPVTVLPVVFGRMHQTPDQAPALGGMTEIVQGGIDHRKGLVAGVAFWVGTGCQNDMIFPGVSFRRCRRLAAERHDRRRSGGHPHDALPGDDGAPPLAGRSGPRSRRAPEHQGVPRRVRAAQRLGREDGAAPRSGR